MSTKSSNSSDTLLAAKIAESWLTAEKAESWRRGKRLRGEVFGTYELGDEIPAGESLRFLAPVQPSIVVCIGLNYKDHAAEMKKKLPDEPLVFLKPPTAVIGPE